MADEEDATIADEKEGTEDNEETKGLEGADGDSSPDPLLPLPV